jgi:uncharacterized membrane protein
MSAFKGQTSITIQAPVEKVYAYLVDFPRHPEWAQNLSKVTQISPGPIQVGTMFKTTEGPPPVPSGRKIRMMFHFIVGLMSGARPYSEAKITALEMNRRIAWQAGVPKKDSYLNFAEWEFIFESQGNATYLIQQFCYAPPDPRGQRMLDAAGVAGIEQACAVSLNQLKKRLEQASNGNR